MSLEDILGASPALSAILALAATRSGGTYRERLGEYERAKREAAALVGYDSAVSGLQSSRAWETFMAEVLAILNL